MRSLVDVREDREVRVKTQGSSAGVPVRTITVADAVWRKGKNQYRTTLTAIHSWPVSEAVKFGQ